MEGIDDFYIFLTILTVFFNICVVCKKWHIEPYI